MNDVVEAVPQARKKAVKAAAPQPSPAPVELGFRSAEFFPLNALAVHPRNMRDKDEPTDPKDEAARITALAENIAAVGLINPLVIVPTPDPETGTERGLVTAGQRRLAALRLLADQGRIAVDEPIEVKTTDEASAHDVTLAENWHRTDPHPANMARAFRELSASGRDPAALAKQYGLGRIEVARLLALGKLCDPILAAWRRGEIDRACAAVFSVIPDLEVQERRFADLRVAHGKGLSHYMARQALNEHRYRVDSAPMAFVTVKAYKAAGGTLAQDLFADRESGQTVADPELLERLAMERLEEVAAPIRAEGWKWVSVTLRSPDGRYSMQKAAPEVVPPSPELAEQLAAARETLRAARAHQDKLEDADDTEEDGAGEGGDGDSGESAWEAACAAVEKAEAEVERLEEGMSTFPEDVRALAGCFVFLNHAGVLQLERGYLQPADAKAYKALTASRARRAAGEGDDAGEGGAAQPAEAGSAEAVAEAAEGLAMSMIHSLSAHRTMALQALVAQNARLGLELAVAALAGPLLREMRGVERGVPGVCLRPVFCTTELTQMEAMDRNPGTAIVDEATNRWKTAFATWLAEHQEAEESNAGAVHGFVAGLSNEDLHALLAVCVARCIDLRTQSASNQSALGLCDLTQLDMRDFFSALHHPYLARSSKASILADAKAAGVIVPDTWPKMKKGELLDVAGEELAARRFVPAYLDYKPAQR